MATFHKRDKDGNLMILTEQENELYERNQRLESRNSCLTKILKWVLMAIAILFILGMIGYCAEEKEKKASSQEETEVETNDNISSVESDNDIKPFNMDELEEIHPNNDEVETAEKDPSIVEEINNRTEEQTMEEIEESQDITQDPTQDETPNEE